MSPQIEPRLSKMPWNILQQIITFTDVFSRISLRKCSKTLRHYVDTSRNTFYKEISLNLVSRNRVQMELISDNSDKVLVEYFKARHYFNKKKSDRHFIQGGPKHLEYAVKDLGSIFKNPKAFANFLRIAGLEYRIPRRYNQDNVVLSQQFALLSAETVLNIKTLHVTLTLTEEQAISILSTVNPEILHEITVSIRGNDEELLELTNLTQWKNARKLNFTGNVSEVRPEQFANFSEINISDLSLSIRHLDVIINMILDNLDFFVFLDVKTAFFDDPRAILDWLRQYQEGAFPWSWIVEVPGSTTVLVVCFQNEGAKFMKIREEDEELKGIYLGVIV